jgi:hypothetical protein
MYSDFTSVLLFFPSLCVHSFHVCYKHALILLKRLLCFMFLYLLMLGVCVCVYVWYDVANLAVFLGVFGVFSVHD